MRHDDEVYIHMQKRSRHTVRSVGIVCTKQQYARRIIFFTVAAGLGGLVRLGHTRAKKK